ncbi:hypothetical protein GCM10020001_072140 [Nonomuraea salmonea]
MGGRRKLGGYEGCARIAELLEPVVEQASPVGAPLFAGWRAVPLPGDPPARAVQLMHVVRELRGGLHANAVIAAGLHPLEATLAAEHDALPLGRSSGEDVARFFTWPEPYERPGPEVVKRRAAVEENTDDLMAEVFSVLTDAESDELIELLRFWGRSLTWQTDCPWTWTSGPGSAKPSSSFPRRATLASPWRWETSPHRLTRADTRSSTSWLRPSRSRRRLWSCPGSSSTPATGT